MFRSNELGQYVPAKSISVKPESQRDYKPNDQIKFNLSQSIGFMDTNDSYLKMTVKVNGGYARPDWSAGAHSLFRRFRIMDGTGSTTLEEVEGYNTLVSTKNTYNSNPSIHKKRGQFEGRSANNDTANQLYFAGPDYDFSASGASVETLPQSLEVDVTIPIHSGILNSGKVFPISATKGLRLEIDTDSANSALSVPYALQKAGAVHGTGTEYAWVTATDKAAADDSKTAISDGFFISIKEPSAPGELDGLGLLYANAGNNPMSAVVGDLLYINTAGGAAGDGTEKKLGVFEGMGCDIGTSNRCKIHYVPDRANTTPIGADFPAGSKVYWKWSDRESMMNDVAPFTAANIPDANSAGTPMKDFAIFKSDFTISNLEYVVSQVSPPSAYTSRMLSQVNSSAGLSLDYNTYTLYRNNVFDADGVQQMLLPARETRSYSVLSVPLTQRDSGSNAELKKRSFFGVLDGAQDYSYIVGGKLVPDRRVQLARLGQTPPLNEALHLIEIEKAVSNCGVPVRDLRNQSRHILIARAFSKYGQVFNTSSQDLQLRVNYSGSTHAKMYMNYICHLRRMNVTSNGVVVVV
jgi:hypothetical protein